MIKTQDFISELRWRGMLHQVTPATEAQLSRESTAGYIGFDPTAPSLHIGNLATILLLKHFQRAGHKPIIVLGGATGMIGDPSGKTTERKLLAEETLRVNQTHIQQQLMQFLDFSDGVNGAVLLNNMDWFKAMDLLQFLRIVGKHLPVNYMMAKESVKARLAHGISFTEFAYQLLQGYDFYHLYANRNVKLQMGGADQWGNLTTGIEIIRRKLGGHAFALTTPLITQANGQKFGKTEQGNIWLSSRMTSPHTFYQFWLNGEDEDAYTWIKVFTLLTRAKIESCIAQHKRAPHRRMLQSVLAKELTIMVHGEPIFKQVEQAAHILFGKASSEDLRQLDEPTLLTLFADAPQVRVSRAQWTHAVDLPSLLSSEIHEKGYISKGEVRRIIQGGGLRINKLRVTAMHQLSDFVPLHEKYLLVQQGKKHYYLIVIHG